MKAFPLVLIAASAQVATASPLTDALARHEPADIEALRSQRADPAARCTLGAVYGKRGDLSRGALYLTGCDTLELPDDLGVEIRKAFRETKKRLDASDYSILEIASRPDALAVTTDALPGEPLVAPTTLWVKAGTYEVRATHADLVYKVSITLAPRARGVAYLDTQVRPKQPATKDGRADFTDEGATEQTSGPPPAIKRPSLMDDKYQGKVGPRGEQIADPLATRGGVRVRRSRPWAVGARIGGGVFDDAVASARAGLAIAGTGRLVLGGRWFAAGRLDWSRRGGGDSVDVVGLSAGAGVRLVGSLAVLAQLRGDLRCAGDRMDVQRAGASVAFGLEVALPSTPLTAGLRFEQGVTELAAGARDRAVLVELGIDWR